MPMAMVPRPLRVRPRILTSMMLLLETVIAVLLNTAGSTMAPVPVQSTVMAREIAPPRMGPESRQLMTPSFKVTWAARPNDRHGAERMQRLLSSPLDATKLWSWSAWAGAEAPTRSTAKAAASAKMGLIMDVRVRVDEIARRRHASGAPRPGSYSGRQRHVLDESVPTRTKAKAADFE